jgi:hypothetical protein
MKFGRGGVPIGADPARLLVAAGLSHPAVDYPPINWPSALEDFTAVRVAPQLDRDADR